MGHYYDREGNPCHFVEVKSRPGDLRPTRVTDARKHNWLPSVTTILNVLDKAALVNWKVNQHLLQAYQVKPEIFPSVDDYLAEVKRLTELEMDKAPSAGTDVHKVLESYFLGEDYPSEHQELCEAVRDAIIEQCGTPAVVFPELRFAAPEGFGGCIDLPFFAGPQAWVVDFKTKQTADKFKPGKMAYPDHTRQLAAYRRGWGEWGARCANVFICIETGEVDFHEHSQADLERGWETFQDCLNIWKRENYDPSFKEEAA